MALKVFLISLAIVIATLFALKVQADNMTGDEKAEFTFYEKLPKRIYATCSVMFLAAVVAFVSFIIFVITA